VEGGNWTYDRPKFLLDAIESDSGTPQRCGVHDELTISPDFPRQGDLVYRDRDDPASRFSKCTEIITGKMEDGLEDVKGTTAQVVTGGRPEQGIIGHLSTEPKECALSQSNPSPSPRTSPPPHWVYHAKYDTHLGFFSSFSHDILPNFRPFHHCHPACL